MEDYAGVFAANLRKTRLSLGLTQAALAEQIGYSEKAVSKWERGIAIPPVETLISLADVMQSGLDALFDHGEPASYFLGIDGGATKTDFALADAAGNILQSLQLGPCNPVDIGTEAAFRLLGKGIRDVTQGIPLRKISVFAGISGGSTGDMKERINEFLSGFHFAKVQNGSDAENIVAAGLKGKDGIAVIMGTGSVAFAVRDGNMHRIGGYGYLFDVGGNGFTLGRDAIVAALSHEEGSGPSTVLTRLFCRETGKSSVLASLGDFYSLGKTKIASFAPLVSEAYRLGDGVAAGILRRNMQEIARFLEAGASYIGREHLPVVPVVLIGGLTKDFAILEPMLREALREPEIFRFSVYAERPVTGALLLAGMKQEEKSAC